MTDAENQVNETPDAPEASTEPAPTAAVEMPTTAEAATEETPSPPPAGSVFWGTGRRKTAVARVRLVPGDGTIKINKRDLNAYFNEPQELAAVSAPLETTKTARHFNVLVNVNGGGHTGQAGAILLGVARALIKADHRHEAALRDAGYLTRDSREVERKKYGRRKARRRFQFSKR